MPNPSNEPTAEKRARIDAQYAAQVEAQDAKTIERLRAKGYVISEPLREEFLEG